MKDRNYKDKQRRIEARVHWMVKNRINYFQPTISPAPKLEQQIESLEAALSFYSDFGYNVILQPKYMGSYCCIYLNRNHEESYFTSRNGYKIDHVEGLHEASKEIHERVFSDARAAQANTGRVPIGLVEWILVEAELLPWRALGEGLIEREYVNYHTCHRQHHSHLFNSSIVDKVMRNVKTSYDTEKRHLVRQYEAMGNFLNIVPEETTYDKGIDLYGQQLTKYAKQEDVSFAPFNVIKFVTKDREYKCLHNNYFDEISQLVWCRGGITDEWWEGARDFQNKHKDIEGIMVKPFKQGAVGIPPALKVRNNDYLQLIYGVGFNDRYQYHLEKRNVGTKLKTSIKQYEIARQLVNIPLNQCVSENKRYVELLYQAIDADEFVKTLDTRL